ncbi:MAG: hypothetical protein KJZ85_16425 [Rhodobacteraceae bacterium]|jgi:hypothetical protein|nr:hypothetical protein [Paracoccaceae bacterium]
MRSAEFEKWASGAGGLNAASARSYVSYLASVEQSYGIDLDRDWSSTRLTVVRSRLDQDGALNRNTQRNRMSALAKYEDFCTATRR